jgi:DNA-binding transcriptional LysR family regulator
MFGNQGITLNHVDLNLLTGLDALLEHRSVQDAAAQLHLTPPAVSRILSRLRAATGDEILVRSGREMIPTAHALQLREEVRDLVSRAERVLTPTREFDLAALSRTFTIRCHDALLTSLAPGLFSAVAERAPHVALRIIGENPADDRELSRGEVDFEIGSPPAGSPSISTRVVAVDEMVLAVRRGSALDVPHPTAEQLARALHVVVTRRGKGRGPLDDHLRELGLSRHIAAMVPTVSAAIAVVAATEAVTVLPAHLRDPLPRELTTRPLPFALESAPAAISWHRRHDTDPAYAWMRELIASTLSAALEPPLDGPELSQQRMP